MKIKKNINKKIIFSLIVVISLCLSLCVLGLIYKYFPSFNDFKIQTIKEENDKLYLYIEEVKSAVNYNVTIFDDSDNLIYEKNSKTNKIDISDLILDNNQSVMIKVSAKSKKNEEKKSLNEYKYTNKYASFQTIKDHFVNKNENIVLYLTGYSDLEKYYIELYSNDSKVYEVDVLNSLTKIEHSKLEGYDGKVVAKLYNSKKRVVSKYNVYLNAPPISDFKITSPSDNIELNYDDVDLYYEGGENATMLDIKLYSTQKKNKILNTMTLSFEENHVKLPASLFKENTSYIMEVTASYQGYNEIGKKDSIKINILGKATVKPVYTDKNFSFIKKDTIVNLKTDTNGATIYYTLDGTKPDRGSFIYKEPIKISMNTTIKTYAVKDNMYDSDINVYDFKVQDKDLVVYLSPSNQGKNYGISDVGYTTEKEQMNLLADYLEKYLKDAGIKVYRNNPNDPIGINSWLYESNMKKSDFHFAIHSNASVEHTAHGIEIYVDNPTSKCLSIASNIYNNLYDIYPNKDEKSNRGVKFARGSLGEVNDDFIKCGALIEVAYHDDYNDAKWIVQNKEEIAKNLADTIIDFYQVNN